MQFLIYYFALFLSSAGAVHTEGLWIPRHETLSPRSWRMDFQVLNSLDKEASPISATHNSAVGMSYGVYGGEIVAAELGFDWKEPATSQTINALFLNFKISTNWYREKGWGVTAGIYDFGFSGGETNFNTMYLIFQNGWGSNWSTTLGAYAGNSNLLLRTSGEKDGRGIVAGLWRQMARDFAGGIEFQSSQSKYGYLFAGFKWEIKNETHLNIGYGISNSQELKDWILVRISLLL